MRALRRSVNSFVFLSLALLAAACRGEDRSIRAESAEPAMTSVGPERPVTASSAARPRVVALGDSLTAGLGIRTDQAYPALLEKRFRDAGYDFEVVNAGVSGDTSAGALRRLDWALDGDVRIIIVALGGNDGLRGLSVEDMKRNLSAIIEGAQRRNVQVLLAGMEAPPNFGPDYTVQFRDAFRDVAAKYNVVFVPFLLTGVAGDAALNQSDGIHPNEEGARRVAEHLWPSLQPMLAKTATQ